MGACWCGVSGEANARVIAVGAAPELAGAFTKVLARMLLGESVVDKRERLNISATLG